jgi:DegV family protein with EDD domain
MEKIAVLVDTGSDITPEMAEDLGVYLIPLYINIDGKSYKEQYEIGQKELNEWLIKNPKKYAKTSTASPAEIVHMYEKIKEDGYHKLIFITISSTLSSFVQMARLIEEDDLQVAVIDSESIGMGEGVMAIYAKELIDQGYSFEEVVEKLEEMKEKRDIFIRFSNTEYLKAGGRMGHAASKILSTLRLSPLIHVDKTGKLSIKKLKIKDIDALDRIVELIKEGLEGVEKYYIAIADEDYLEGAKYLEKQLAGLIEKADKFVMTRLCPTISANIGPGAVGAFYVVLD